MEDKEGLPYGVGTRAFLPYGFPRLLGKNTATISDLYKKRFNAHSLRTEH